MTWLDGRWRTPAAEGEKVSLGHYPAAARDCPVCGLGWVHRLPCCAACWTVVPIETKHHLGRLRFGSPEYLGALDLALAELRFCQSEP